MLLSSMCRRRRRRNGSAALPWIYPGRSHGSGRRVGQRGQSCCRQPQPNAAPPPAEPLAKASREAGTEGQTEAASSTSQGRRCPRATPAARCHRGRLAVVGDRCSSSLESPLQQAAEKGSSQPARASLALWESCGQDELSEHSRAGVRPPVEEEWGPAALETMALLLC